MVLTVLFTCLINSNVLAVHIWYLYANAFWKTCSWFVCVCKCDVSCNISVRPDRFVHLQWAFIIFFRDVLDLIFDFFLVSRRCFFFLLSLLFREAKSEKTMCIYRAKLTVQMYTKHYKIKRQNNIKYKHQR